MRGRKPKPLSLHRLAGTWRADRHSGAPEPPPGADPPAWLSPAAHVEWHRLAGPLAEAGMLTPWDADALGELCELLVELVAAAEAMRGVELVAETTAGRRVAPELLAYERLHKLVLPLMRDFGLTPASRPRMPRAEPAPPDFALELPKP